MEIELSVFVLINQMTDQLTILIWVCSSPKKVPVSSQKNWHLGMISIEQAKTSGFLQQIVNSIEESGYSVISLSCEDRSKSLIVAELLKRTYYPQATIIEF